MSLKDRLKQKVEQSRSSVANRLPPGFTKRLEERVELNRLTHLYRDKRVFHYFQIDLTPGRMSAEISIYTDADHPVSLAEIEDAVARSGIVHGITMDPIKTKLNDKLELTGPVIGVTVARGTPPQEGRIGHIEELKNALPAGAANDLSKFDPVHENERVATVHPPIPGKPGLNVMGEIKDYAQVVEQEIRLNHLLRREKQDDLLHIIAGANGHLVRKGNELRLETTLKIRGDFTSSRGSVVYPGSVKVEGSMEDQTSLVAGGNLTVEGTVGAVQLDVTGRIDITQGLFGKGEAMIKVGGIVKSLYLNESKMESGSGLSVSKEILNSDIFLLGKLNSPAATMAGGRCFAYGGAELGDIGSSLGIKSLICVGMDRREFILEREIKPKLKKLEQSLDEIMKRLANANDRAKESLGEKREELERQIKNALREAERLRSEMKERNPGATLKVRRGVFPGTVIMIGFEELEVHEKIAGPVTFKLEDGKISRS